jgi:hypothetical protein
MRATAPSIIQRTRLDVPNDQTENPLFKTAAFMTLRSAPLLPDLPEKTATPVERFCTHGPKASDDKGRMSKMAASDMNFSDVLARLDTNVAQASMLLNDRMRTLESRCRSRQPSDTQLAEICNVADAFATASYYITTWAHLLGVPCGLHKPVKSAPCVDLDDAFATMRSASSWLMVSTGVVQKTLIAFLRDRGTFVEKHLSALGVQAEDVRNLVPRLECFITRLSLVLRQHWTCNYESLSGSCRQFTAHNQDWVVAPALIV